MGILDRLFGAWQGRDRLAREPKGHTGGALAPASVQRAHLGLREVDLPAGVVRLRTGEARAILEVGGVTLHQRDPAEALAFLERWAAVLNALPADVAMLQRAHPGGLDQYGAAKAVASRELATRAAGTSLARLAADQLRNAANLVAGGHVRNVVGYLAVREDKGNVRVLLERAGTAMARLQDVGLTVKPLRDTALSMAIADSWRPGLTASWGVDHVLRRPDGALVEEWSLLAESDGRTVRARIEKPRYVDPVDPDSLPTTAPPPTLPISKPSGQPKRAVSGGSRKALSR